MRRSYTWLFLVASATTTGLRVPGTGFASRAKFPRREEPKGSDGTRSLRSSVQRRWAKFRKLFKHPVWRAQFLRRSLFLASTFNVVPCVVRNDYKASFAPFMERHTESKPPMIYRQLFYFARLRPRILFTIGACLRALQMTTPIEHVFDPGVGCGAGLNMLALFVGSRWPAPIITGWAFTKRPWLLLGAEKPPPARVPITVVLKD